MFSYLHWAYSLLYIKASVCVHSGSTSYLCFIQRSVRRWGWALFGGLTFQQCVYFGPCDSRTQLPTMPHSTPTLRGAAQVSFTHDPALTLSQSDAAEPDVFLMSRGAASDLSSFKVTPPIYHLGFSRATPAQTSFIR